jgi:hypothetical protein
MYNIITYDGVKHSFQNRFVGKSIFLFQLVVDFNPVGFGPVVFSNYFICICISLLLITGWNIYSNTYYEKSDFFVQLVDFSPVGFSPVIFWSSCRLVELSFVRENSFSVTHCNGLFTHFSQKKQKKIAWHLWQQIVHRIVWRFVWKIARVDGPLTGFFDMANSDWLQPPPKRAQKVFPPRPMYLLASNSTFSFSIYLGNDFWARFSFPVFKSSKRLARHKSRSTKARLPADSGG